MSNLSFQRARRLATCENLAGLAAPLAPDVDAKIGDAIAKLYAPLTIGPIETAAAIGENAALARRLIHTANHAHHGAGIPATSLEAAVVRLGTGRAKALAVGIHIADALGRPGRTDFNLDFFWQRGLARAVLARALAARLDRRIADLAFLVGLLSHVGIVMLAGRYGRRYTSLYDKCGGHLGRLGVLEYQAFAFNHIHVARRALQRWKCPRDCIDTVSAQLAFPPADPQAHGSLRLWQIAHVVGALPVGCRRAADWTDAAIARFMEKTLSVSAEYIPAVFAHATEGFRDIAPLFEEHIPASSDPAELFEPVLSVLGRPLDVSDRETTAAQPVQTNRANDRFKTVRDTEEQRVGDPILTR